MEDGMTTVFSGQPNTFEIQVTLEKSTLPAKDTDASKNKNKNLS